MLIGKGKRPDHEGYESDDDRECQTGVDVPRSSHQARGDDGKKPSEPAIAEVIRKRKRGVPDFCREGFDQKCCDRTIHHRHEHDLNEDQRCQRDSIHRARVKLHRVIDRHV